MHEFKKPLSGPEQKFADKVEQAAKEYEVDIASQRMMAGESDAAPKKVNWMKLLQILTTVLGLFAQKDADGE